MKPYSAKRVVRTALLSLQGPPSKVFPLLCPTREYDWIEEWRCDLIYSVSGFAEEGCIFRTEFPWEPGPEVWTVSRYEPFKAIEFVRVTPGVRVIKLDIWLSDKGDGTSSVLWRQAVTGLSDAGNDWVDAYSPEIYEERMAVLEAKLNHYLSTGTKLTASAASPQGAPKKG